MKWFYLTSNWIEKENKRKRANTLIPTLPLSTCLRDNTKIISQAVNNGHEQEKKNKQIYWTEIDSALKNSLCLMMYVLCLFLSLALSVFIIYFFIMVIWIIMEILCHISSNNKTNDYDSKNRHIIVCHR